MKSYNTPFTVESLVALEEAILQGVQTVKYSDKEISYRSLDDMLRIRDLLRSKLGMDPVSSSNEGRGFFGGKKKIGRHNKGLVE